MVREDSLSLAVEDRLILNRADTLGEDKLPPDYYVACKKLLGDLAMSAIDAGVDVELAASVRQDELFLLHLSSPRAATQTATGELNSQALQAPRPQQPELFEDIFGQDTLPY